MNKYYRLLAGLIIVNYASLYGMQPIKIDDRYYYSTQDNHNHLQQVFFDLLKKAYNALPFTHNSNAVSRYDVPHCQNIPLSHSLDPRITWIGHASFLIQVGGYNILTDPIFGDVKAGSVTFKKRILPPGVLLKDLPPIDIIVISHNHSDHTDEDCLRYLSKKYNPTVFVPAGNAELFREFGFEKIIEQNWWDTHTSCHNTQPVTITCLPAYHWSIRFSLHSYRKSLWASWMISIDTMRIFFAGDTAYGQHFKQIASAFPDIGVALLPIGPTSLTDSSKRISHIDAIQAVDAFVDLKACTFIPMHYATFSHSKESLEYPLDYLHSSWNTRYADLADAKLLIPICGKEYEIEKL
jgi:L-ascorbate metabolism protein UlaG (beta-lactamase superfamily)